MSQSILPEVPFKVKPASRPLFSRRWSKSRFQGQVVESYLAAAHAQLESPTTAQNFFQSFFRSNDVIGKLGLNEVTDGRKSVGRENSYPITSLIRLSDGCTNACGINFHLRGRVGAGKRGMKRVNIM